MKKTQKTIDELTEELNDISETLLEAKRKRAMKEEDPKDEKDPEDEKDKDNDDVDVVDNIKKDKKDEKDPEDKDDEEEDKDELKSKKAKFKKLMDSYREEDQPEPKTVGEPLKKKKTPFGESVVEIFDGENLSEDFKKKATTIFEAALTSRLNEETSKIENAALQTLEYMTEEIEADLVEKTDEYLNYIGQEWLEENKVEVESHLKTEIYETFFDGLKTLFLEANINMDDKQLKNLDESKNEVKELTETTNDLTQEILTANKTILEMKKVNAISVLSEGLTDTQSEKMKLLTQDIEASDIEIFEDKATIIRESYFKENKIIKSNNNDEEIHKSVIDKNVQIYLDHAKEYNK